jgi:hypothetical protein
MSIKSNSGYTKFVPSFITDYFNKKVFGFCRDNLTVNSGLNMGYSGYLKIVYSYVVNGGSSDDQRNINKNCSKLPFLKIDTNNIIFQNCGSISEVNNSKAFFCQLPGVISFKRITRAITEYIQFFIPEIIILIAVIILIVVINCKKK